MLSFFRFIMDVSLLRPILRPITRLIVSMIAVPIFRSLTRRVLRVETLDAELEKDLEQWFRGAILLLLATQNMESTIFPWVKPVVQARYTSEAGEELGSEDSNTPEDDEGQKEEETEAELQVDDNDSGWLLLGLRVMLAIGVIQMMPDQELFAVIHNGPPKMSFDRKSKWLPQIKDQWWPITKGLVCLHLNRSSPVFAILATIAPGGLGWICYGMALTQYLIIGLVTSRDKALDVLTLFDETMQAQRQELVEELHLADQEAEVPETGDSVLEEEAS